MAVPSQTAASVVETAFQRLKTTVAANDAHKFDSTTLKDVRQAALDIEKAQRQRASVRNMRKLEPFLKALEIYAKPLDVLCNGTPFLPWIWAPVKLLLQIASQYNDIFDRLLDAYAQLAEVLPRFDRYAKTFSEPEFHAPLAYVYADIAEFHRRAYKFFRQRAWRLLFDSGWKSFELRFNAILARLKEHRDNVDKEACSFDIQAASIARRKWDEEIAMAEAERESIHQQAVFAWLAVDDCQQDNVLLELTEKRHGNTCDWFLGHTKYKQWITAARWPLIWLHGIPGSGKSVLCTRVISDLRDAKKNVLYYFSRSSISSGDPCEHVLRTLCAQILRVNRDLTELVWAQYVTSAALPSIGTLRVLLPQLLSALPSTSLVIDGIDELPVSDMRTTLQSLLKIAKGDQHNLRVFLSSRNEPTIGQQMREALKVSLREEHSAVQQDIKTFLHKRLHEAFVDWSISISDKTKGLVEAELLRRSRGMFLWVELVINNLQFCFTDEDVLEGVKLLPVTLREAYDRILCRIFGVDSAIVRSKISRLLQMLSYTRRSLSLKETLCALSIMPDSINAPLPLPMDQKLLDYCKPLIEVAANGSVDLIHFSAVEYLQSPESKYHLRAEESELTLGNLCLTYLQYTASFLDQSQDSERWAQIVNGSHDIHRYAMMHWTSHTLACLRQPFQADLRSKALLRARLNISWWLLKRLDQQDTNQALPGANAEADMEPNPWDLLPESLRLMAIRGKSSDQSPPLLGEVESPGDLRDKLEEYDLTWLSAIQNQYENDVAHLLDHTRDATSLGLDPKALEEFRLANAPGVLFCRVWNCLRGEAPFRTTRERDLHEIAHLPRYQCNELHCSRGGQGFRSEKLLKMHKEKYHSDFSNLTVPKLPVAVHQQAQQMDMTAQQVNGTAIPTQADIDRPPTASVHSNAPPSSMPPIRPIKREEKPIWAQTARTKPLKLGEKGARARQPRNDAPMNEIKRPQFPKTQGILDDNMRHALIDRQRQSQQGQMGMDPNRPGMQQKQPITTQQQPRQHPQIQQMQQQPQARPAQQQIAPQQQMMQQGQTIDNMLPARQFIDPYAEQRYQHQLSSYQSQHMGKAAPNNSGNPGKMSLNELSRITQERVTQEAGQNAGGKSGEQQQQMSRQQQQQIKEDEDMLAGLMRRPQQLEEAQQRELIMLEQQQKKQKKQQQQQQLREAHHLQELAMMQEQARQRQKQRRTQVQADMQRSQSTIPRHVESNGNDQWAMHDARGRPTMYPQRVNPSGQFLMQSQGNDDDWKQVFGIGPDEKLMSPVFSPHDNSLQEGKIANSLVRVALWNLES